MPEEAKPSDDLFRREMIERILGWDQKVGSASELRKKVRSMAPFSGIPKSDDEKTIALLQSAYAEKRPQRLKMAPTKSQRRAALLGPFLGDPEMGRWPWKEPLKIGEEEAIGWLPILGEHAGTDAPEVLEFLLEFFHARKREIWIPASYALGHYARRGEPGFGVVEGRWKAIFPNGLPRKDLSPTDGDVSRIRRDGGAFRDLFRDTQSETISRHDIRHGLHLFCCFLGCGGNPDRIPGFIQPADFASRKLPGDPADASAVLEALFALLRSERIRPEILRFLPDRVRETPAETMCEETLREIADFLRQDPAAAEPVRGIESRLAETRWANQKGMVRLEGFWSWQNTAAWFKDGKNPEGVSVMRDKASKEGVREILDLALDGKIPEGFSDPAAAIIPSIQTLFQGEMYQTIGDREKTRLLARLFLLVSSPEVAGLSWPLLVRRACGEDAERSCRPGTVKDSALVDIVKAFSPYDEVPSFLLRKRHLASEDLLRLVPSGNGFIATQVAIQLERLLREADDPEEQVRLLWKVLQGNPPSKTFRELGSVLRGQGKPTPLSRVVSAVQNLDSIRERNGTIGEVGAGFQRLVDEVGSLFPSPPEGKPRDVPGEPLVLEMLEFLGGMLPKVAALNRSSPPSASTVEQPGLAEIGSGSWCEPLGLLLLGDGRPGRSGLSGFVDWLGNPIPDLDVAWKRFAESARRLYSAKLAPTLDQCREFGDSLSVLGAKLSGVAWPEAMVVADSLRNAGEWLNGRLLLARRSEGENERVQRLLDSGEEEPIRALLLPGERSGLANLSESTLRNVGQFLLDHLLFRDAQDLGTLVQDRVRIKSKWGHLQPLLLCVLGGSILFLDVGTDWNSVIGQGFPFFMTVFSAQFLSFFLLTADLAGRMIPASATTGMKIDLLRKAVRRVMPVYLLSMVLSIAVSALTLVSLGNSDLRFSISDRLVVHGPEILHERDLLPWGDQLALWSSFSLFLGVFLGLVVQGRSAASSD